MVDSYLTYETSTTMIDNLVEGNEDQTIDGDTVTFTGEMENQNDFEVTDVIVVIVVKDKTTGKVVGASYQWLSDPIPAGEKEAYEITVYLQAGMNHDDVEYSVYARGRRPE
jgi:hypothetical protein